MNYIFEAGADILEAFIVMQFLFRYFGLRDARHNRIKFTVMSLIYAIGMQIMNLAGVRMIYQEYIAAVIIYALAVLFLKGRRFEYALVAQMSAMIFATAIILTYGVLLSWTQWHFGLSGSVIISMAAELIKDGIYVAVTETIIRHQVRDKQYVSDKTYIEVNIVMLAMIFASVFIANIIYANSDNMKLAGEGYLIIILLLAVGMLIYALFIELTNNGIKLIKEQIKNSAYESEKKEIGAMHEQHVRTMQIRNDLYNQLMYILLKLKEGNVDDAKKYLKDNLDVRLAGVSYVSTQNRMADAIINKHIEYAAQHGILFDIDIECNLDSIDEVDAAIILSNLLDNAFEAAAKCRSPEAGLKIIYAGTRYHFTVTNSCSEAPELEDGEPVTTKDDRFIHGYGLLNVKNITEKYDGMYGFDYKDGIYTADVVLNVTDEVDE